MYLQSLTDRQSFDAASDLVAEHGDEAVLEAALLADATPAVPAVVIAAAVVAGQELDDVVLVMVVGDVCLVQQGIIHTSILVKHLRADATISSLSHGRRRSLPCGEEDGTYVAALRLWTRRVHGASALDHLLHLPNACG